MSPIWKRRVFTIFISNTVLLQLSWHAVTRDVGNVRNQDPDLNKPVNPEKDVKSGASLMSNWLKRGKKGETEEKKDDGPPPEKKSK